MATHSSIHTWRIQWTEEPGGLQSMGLQRIGQDLATKQQQQQQQQQQLRTGDISGHSKTHSKMAWVNFVHPFSQNQKSSCINFQGQLAVATNGFITSLPLLDPYMPSSRYHLRAHVLAPRGIHLLWSLKINVVHTLALGLSNFAKFSPILPWKNNGFAAGQTFLSYFLKHISHVSWTLW